MLTGGQVPAQPLTAPGGSSQSSALAPSHLSLTAGTGEPPETAGIAPGRDLAAPSTENICPVTPLQDEECFLGAFIRPVFAAFTPRHELQGPCGLLQGATHGSPQPMAIGAGQRKETLLQLGAARAAQNVHIGAPGLFSLDATSKEMQSSGLLVTQAGNRCNPTALLLPQKAQRRNQPGLLGNDRLLPDGARLSTAAAPQASSFTPSREKPKASLQTAPGFG